jgi:branched-chain amino acid transport system substrate-binding protein
MAAEEINAKGGVKGKKFALSFEDSTGKPEIARAIVEKLIDSKKQLIIVGEYTSSCAKAVAAVAEERKTPYLIVASADDAITQQNYKYVFRQNQVNAHYADAFFSFLKEVVKPKTIAVLYESSAFGTSGADAMETDAKKLNIQVVLKEKFETGAIDFKPLLSKVKAAQPDVIYTILCQRGAAHHEASQGAAHRCKAVCRRGGRVRHSRVHQRGEGRCRICHQRDTLDTPGQVSRSQRVCQ